MCAGHVIPWQCRIAVDSKRILHVLHQHIQRFCSARRTIYAAQQLSNLCLSNGLEDLENDGEVDFLRQGRPVS